MPSSRCRLHCHWQCLWELNGTHTLSEAGNEPPGDYGPPQIERGGETLAERPGRLIERRSPTRPEFIEGWHKELVRKLARAQVAPASNATITDRIVIWMANPDALLRAESCLKILNDEDWCSLNRIQDPSSRRSAIAGRVLLRIGLSQAADHKAAPSDWRFATAAHDKPIVAEGLPAIHFSVSHTDQFAVVAVSATLDIGIDVECVDQDVSKNVIADFCHLDEHHAVGGLPRPQEIREFIRLWTLKEAYSKMIGLGHFLDFKSVKFTLDPADLKSANNGEKANASTQFETFFISYKHALFHVSLAMRHPAASAGSTELQILNLANSAGEDAAFPASLSG
jgi:phosphopantetheinyl transferase